MPELGKPQAELATITFEQHGTTVHARLAGELDMSNAGDIHQRLLTAGRDSLRLLVDLSELTFIDSAGVSALDQLNLALTQDGQLQIIAPDGSIPARTLALVGMDKILPMVPPEQALHDGGGPVRPGQP